MHVDAAILGGGSGGYAAAIRTAQLGRSVVLVEADAVGGTCLHRGCVPTKALLRVGEVADLARDGARYGVRTSLDEIDVAAVHEFKNSVKDRFHKGLNGLLNSLGVTVVKGYGRLSGPREITVGQQRIEADAIVVATGSVPRSLPGVAIGGRVLTSDEALELDNVPERVAVLGGGVVGVEFASLWASLGSEVTLIEALPSLLPNEDPDCLKHLVRAFKKRKIQIRTNATVTGVEQDSNNLTLTFETGEPLVVDYLLVAVGRRPRTEDVGLESIGVDLVDGFVKTDARLQSSVAGVYAVGDIVAGPQLAHRSFQQGVFVAEELADKQPKAINDDVIPRVTYSHPELAAVGLTEREARERYGDTVRVAQHDLAGNAKSFLLGTGGTVKVISAGDGRVVGVHMVGDRVGELVGEAQILCGTTILVSDAADLVHAHPSQGEALGEALMAVAGRPLHGH